jgi:hypothetical protein
MKKPLYAFLIMLSFIGCKFYSETLTLNDDMLSGKMEVYISYDVAEAQKNKVARATETSLKKNFDKYKGITLTANSVTYKKEYNRDYVDLKFNFDSDKAFNALANDKTSVGEAGSMKLYFDMDEWCVIYTRKVNLDPHDEADYGLVIPDDFKVVETNAQDSDDNVLSWYFKSEGSALETEMFAWLKEK